MWLPGVCAHVTPANKPCRPPFYETTSYQRRQNLEALLIEIEAWANEPTAHDLGL